LESTSFSQRAQAMTRRAALHNLIALDRLIRIAKLPVDWQSCARRRCRCLNELKPAGISQRTIATRTAGSIPKG
jgi:hypothetical protein